MHTYIKQTNTLLKLYEIDGTVCQLQVRYWVL